MKALLLIMMIELCTALAAGMLVIHRQNNKKFSWELVFLPALELPVLLLFLVQFGAFRISSEVANERVQMFVFALAFLAMNAAVFLMVNQSRNEAAERNMAEARHRAELERMHFERVRECRQELSGIQSEYDAMLAQVSSLIEKNRTDTAGRLLKDLSEKIDSTREEPFCQIAAVNAILTAKKKECDRENIALETNLLLPGGLPVKDLDLCMALGNLMDNAIRECKKAPWVTLQASETKQLSRRTEEENIQRTQDALGASEKSGLPEGAEKSDAKEGIVKPDGKKETVKPDSKEGTAKPNGKGESVRPQISLTGKALQDYLVLRCTNPVYSAEQREPEGTGRGLKILRDMAKRYHGDFFVKRTEKSFLAQISLFLSAADGKV